MISQTITRRGSVAALALALAFTGFVGPAAQAYPNSVSLAVTHYKQDKANYCWVTSARVVIRYHDGTAPTQCSLYNTVKGTTNCPDGTGTLANVRSLLAANLTAPGTAQTGAITQSTLMSELSSGRPIPYAFYPNAVGVGHMVTVYGYSASSQGVAVSSSNWNGAVGSSAGQTGAYTYTTLFSSFLTFGGKSYYSGGYITGADN